MRAYAYPASIVPILLGASMPGMRPAGSSRGILLALAAGMLYHTGCNLLNDYYDYRYGVDRPGAFGGNGLLVPDDDPAADRPRGVASLAVGSLIGFYLSAGTACPYSSSVSPVFSAPFYTATPYGLKYHALGEPLVFPAMGVGMVLGGFATQGAG